MLHTDKRESLSPLLESSNQIHLTIYLRNRRNDLIDLRRQIIACLIEAKRSLEPVLTSGEQSDLLHPIESLLENANILSQMKGNIGLFRTRSAFRVLSLPVDVKRRTHVASTFHVKPLLRWMQWDSDFLILGFDQDAAHLYQGSQDSLRKLDTLYYSKKLSTLLHRADALTPREIFELQKETAQTFSWINDWMDDTISRPRIKLFLAGERRLTQIFSMQHSDTRLVKTPICAGSSEFGFAEFKEEQVPAITQRIRAVLLSETRDKLEKTLLMFQVADRLNLAQKDIREIAKAAVQGKVKKLVIAENREVFGKLDPKTGRLSIHPFDLDHEDDDLLDDLAQRVLISGGEVFVAKKEEIPKGRPLLAILDHPEEDEERAANLSGLGTVAQALQTHSPS